MKLGLILVASRTSNLHHSYCHQLRSLPSELQTLVWNARGDFANFINSTMTSDKCIPKMIISDTVSHLDIAKRVQEIQWFVNCDSVLILNYGRVELKITDNVLELSPQSEEDFTIVESKMVVKIRANNGKIDNDMIGILSRMRNEGKHQSVIDTADKMRDLISDRNKHLVWFEESISSYYANDKKRGREACEKLLELPNIEEWMRTNVQKNIQFY